MKKLIVVLSLVLAAAGMKAADTDSLRYRISLKDKVGTEYSLSKPQEFLSERALARRQRQGISVDSTDLPVSRTYLQAIEREGGHVVLKGKWENFVTISTNDHSVAERISRLPFVTKVEKVWSLGSSKPTTTAERRFPVANEVVEHPDSIYGSGTAQIQISNGDKLHEAGFRGEGKVIGILDGGFHNYDQITTLDNVTVLGTYDVVDPGSDIFAASSHGLSVLSCIGTNRPYQMIGTAPGASFWLIRTENESSETPVEEDNWCIGVEFCDSVGVDVMNTSLGYNEFDDPSMNYTIRDLDGKKSLMSRQASRIASKGMILVCSAGNSGSNNWKKTTAPGDASDILCVGAIDKEGKLAPFSSIGTTSDGRIKPDVVAVGLGSDVLRPNGNQGRANGTSFASPIMCGMVTCLWQACPNLTAKQVIELVKSAGDRADMPDNIFGWGIPDMWKAYQAYVSGRATVDF